MQRQTVLVSGASVAGTTLAYWLLQHGFTPVVVEKAPGVRPGGYKIDLRGAALTVADRTGVLEEIRRHRTDVRDAAVVDARGNRVKSMDADSFGGRVHGDAEIMRGDLTRILYDLTKDKVDYRFGDSVAELEQGPDGVRVTFESGRTETFDLVVGADGLHSRTRALAFGPEEDFLHEMGYHVSIFSVPNHLGLDREELTYVGPGRTALTYTTAQDTGAKAMFLWSSRPQDRGRHGTAEQQRLLAEAYGTEGWEVPRFLEALPDAPDFSFDSLSQVHMDRWSTGRVTLVGDAAYCASPASGQGTSLAMVGAYVLAGELAAADDLPAGLAAYERTVRPFAEANQKLGPANVKRMVMGGPAQVRMSLLMLRLLQHLPGQDRMMAKVLEPIQRAANAIELKTY
ncbi:FAD-dependent monooxygenase [Streptomyces sp. WAC06614]|uniref:FAD-dependent monooxygenase n=1 Tax=Streptomyces sp. WAC06614 TaxID=2487416 RepID=UPI000F7985DB|nr:FAD-dependent monooxygenase [Streptomyces sp. WAC06614]RSS80274.1 FAD-dependent oxidoreductase [Streptomyces sp. WAC06614]